MASVVEPDFMKGPRTPLEGLSSSSDARALANQRFPEKPYCLVRDWTIFRIEVTRDELFKCQAAGQLPMILFAHNVAEWAFHAIRPLSPPTSGHLFHGHPAGQSERSDAGLHC